MYFIEKFPDRNTLLKSVQTDHPQFPLKVNNHIHTPHSFSAFNSIEEAVTLAKKEGLQVLGINDFYVTDGYGEFIEKCRKHKIFPLLNVELIGISKKDQEAGTRINDPGNPGRTYISGKAIAFPSILPANQQEKLDRIVKESNVQVAKMIVLLNRWLEFQQTGLSISVTGIMEGLAMGLLRERHVAKALRLKIEETAADDEEYYKLLEQVYGGNKSEKKRDDFAGIEDELRARLLKAGAPAFVPEDEKAFLPLEEITSLITDAGGIPTYPMLLDGAGGGITEFEKNKEKLLEALKERNFHSVEMIPMRNRIEVLKEYAEFFYENGFVVSFGTEHNTTAMQALTVRAKNREPLDERLLEISFNGVSYLAAHQYYTLHEGPGYKGPERSEMEQLGRAILNHYFTSTE